MFLQSWVVARAGLFDFFEQHFFIATVAFALFIVYVFWIILERKKYGIGSLNSVITREGKSIIMWWSVLGVLMFVFFQHSIQPFYFLVLWPLPITAFAWFVDTLARRRKGLGVGLAALFCVIQILQLLYFYPQVYQPLFDHKNLLQDFNSIKYAASGRSFLVSNQFADVNQFYYYEKLTGIGTIETKSGAAQLFVVCGPAHAAACTRPIHSYSLVSSLKKNDLLISQYQKTSN